MSVCCEIKAGKNVPRVLDRNDFLFLAGSIAVIAGLFFPFSEVFMDLLLIFSISLTASVLMITFSARSALQVLGFPLLIILSSTLRLALTIGSAKMTIYQVNAGSIINFLGGAITRDSRLFAVLVFAMMSVLFLYFIIRAGKSIVGRSSDFIETIFPCTEISITSDLQAGQIDNSQADDLRSKLDHEYSFFASMNAVGRFILCIALIEILVALVSIIAGVAIRTPVFAGQVTSGPVATAIGSGIITQVSAIVTALSCGYLVKKSAMSAVGFEVSEKQSGKKTRKIEVAIKEEENTVAAEAQWVENIPSQNSSDYLLYLWKNFKDDKCYDAVEDYIKSKPNASALLIAADSIENLSVTVPVNIAIRLAKEQKCLLIDLDREREAISNVFDIESESESGSAVKTCIDGLWVWSASNAGNNPDLKIEEFIAEFKKDFDRLIIYAPDINGSSEICKINACVNSAMLFGSETETGESSMSDLYGLLVSFGCDIFEPEFERS